MYTYVYANIIAKIKSTYIMILLNVLKNKDTFDSEPFLFPKNTDQQFVIHLHHHRWIM